MSGYEILLISIGLAMDSFAVSLCKGLEMPKLNIKNGFIIALFFGFFQGFMPFIGWLLGRNFEKYITSIDHWIAFVLLLFIGGKMLYESLCNTDEAICDHNCEICKKQNCKALHLNIKELFVAAIATSIDALAVGITFAFLQVQIYLSVFTIAFVTFILSLIGVVLGNKFGIRYKNKASIAGGIILISLGTKILLEGIGVIL